MATAFQPNAFQNLGTHGIAGFQVDGVLSTGGGHGGKKGGSHQKRIYVFADGTLGYCNAIEAAAIAAEMDMRLPAKQKPVAPKVVTRKTEVVVARQQLLGFIKSNPIPDTEPARREAAQILRQLRANQRKLEELEDEEALAFIITMI